MNCERTLDDVAREHVEAHADRELREAEGLVAIAIARTWPSRWTDVTDAPRLTAELINLEWTPPRNR